MRAEYLATVTPRMLANPNVCNISFSGQLLGILKSPRAVNAEIKVSVNIEHKSEKAVLKAK